MRICFVSDDRLCLAPDGTYYSNTGYDWRAFASLFGEEPVRITFLARVTRAESPPEGWAPHVLDERTRIVALPWFDKYRAFVRLPAAMWILFKQLLRCDLAWLVVPNVYPTAAYPIARALRRPVLAWCVGDVSETALMVYDELPMRMAYRTYARITRRIVRRADVGVVASQTLAERYAGERDLMVAYRSLRDPGYLASKKPRTEAHTIVYLGRLSPEKGARTLIDAFEQVRSARPDARLVVAGDGVQREELELAVKRAEMEDAVEFRGWVPHGPELKKLLASVDLLCLPSYSEGMPAALLEGMSAGLPVVGTTVGDIPAVIALYGAGVVVPPRDAGALAAALTDVMSDPDRYRAMCDAAARTARDLGFAHETGKVAGAALAAVRAR